MKKLSPAQLFVLQKLVEGDEIKRFGGTFSEPRWSTVPKDGRMSGWKTIRMATMERLEKEQYVEIKIDTLRYPTKVWAVITQKGRDYVQNQS